MNRNARPNLLIVDDDPVFRRLLSVMFTQEGYLVATADCAELALKLLNTRHFQVAVVDYKLPDLNGIDFFEKVKHKYPEMTRILMTAHTSEDVLLEAINRGEVYRYINKPVHTGLLRSTVEQALALNQLKVSRNVMLKEMDERNRELVQKNEELKASNLIISEMKVQQDRILATLPDPFLLTRDDLRIFRCNPAAANFFGYQRAEMVGLNIRELFEDPDYINQKISECNTTKSSIFETNMRKRDGEIFAMKVFLSTFKSKFRQNTDNSIVAIFAQKLPRKPLAAVIDEPLIKNVSKTLSDKSMEEIQNLFDSIAYAIKDLTEQWKVAVDLFDFYLEDEGIPASQASAIRKATDEVTNAIKVLLEKIIID